MNDKKPYDLKRFNPEQEIPLFPKDNPFKVPEGYFGLFTERLMERPEINAINRHHRIFRLQRYYWAAAVIMIFMGIASIFIIKHGNGVKSEDLPYFSINLDELEQVYPIESFDEFTVITLYTEKEKLSALSGNVIFQDAIDNDTLIQDNDIEQYLIQSNDLESLITDL